MHLPLHQRSALFDIVRQVPPEAISDPEYSTSCPTLLRAGHVATRRLVEIMQPYRDAYPGLRIAPHPTLPGNHISIFHADEVGAAVTALMRHKGQRDAAGIKTQARRLRKTLGSMLHTFAHDPIEAGPAAFNTVVTRTGKDGRARMMLQPPKHSEDPAVVTMRAERRGCFNTLRDRLGYYTPDEADIGYSLAELPAGLNPKITGHFNSLVQHAVTLQLTGGENDTSLPLGRVILPGSLTEYDFTRYDAGQPTGTYLEPIFLASGPTGLPQTSPERIVIDGREWPFTAIDAPSAPVISEAPHPDPMALPTPRTGNEPALPIDSLHISSGNTN